MTAETAKLKTERRHKVGAHLPSSPPVSWRIPLTLCAFLGASFAVLVPRPTYPQTLPLPLIDPTYQQQREEAEIALAASARNDSLAWEIRAIGEQVRRIGRANAQGATSSQNNVRALRQDVQGLLKTEHGARSLLSLRALQAELFLAALDEFERTGKESAELVELSGPFLRDVGATWIDEEGRLLPARSALRLSYRVYWTGLVGLLDVPPFSPTLEEQRRYYRTNLLYPPARSQEPIALNMSRLSTVRALSRSDPEYPAALAQGILQINLGQFAKAERSLRAHLHTRPDGSWAQIAKNHLLLAAKKAHLGYESALSPSR